MTLVKAKVGSMEDREYYKQYCKEGVDFAKMVRKNLHYQVNGQKNTHVNSEYTVHFNVCT